MTRLVVLAAAVNLASAAERPLWEVGVGAGGLGFSAYRGADELSYLASPVPYVIYRGPLLRVGQDGARLRWAPTPSLRLSLSAAGSLPVDSNEVEARQGMDDLDPTAEIGPQLQYFLFRSARTSLSLRWPVRAILAIGDDIEAIGWLTRPRLQISWSLDGDENSWSFNSSIGPIWATGRYHDYFYAVSAADARPGRPAYDAGGGYSGLRLGSSVYRQIGPWRVSGFMDWDYLGGTAFEDSPLVETEQSWLFGLAISYRLWRSRRTVKSSEGGGD